MCAAAARAGTCEANESYPGLWEIPMWAVHREDLSAISAMDPEGDQLTLFEAYKRELDWRLNGNKAPLGLFLHAGRQLANTGCGRRCAAPTRPLL